MRPKDKIHESWLPHLNKIGNFYIYPDILTNYYPEYPDVFNVFTMPLDEIRVVILGQDPYPKQGQAIGYAFAVSEDTTKPASLRIIEKEVGQEVDRTLKKWREQGVFLLNTALTVEKNNASSHIPHWEMFTITVMEIISTVNPCVWMLWGKYAQGYKSHIKNFVYEYPLSHELTKNVILEAPHPASEAYRKGAGFIGCGHFEKANKALYAKGLSQIEW